MPSIYADIPLILAAGMLLWWGTVCEITGSHEFVSALLFKVMPLAVSFCLVLIVSGVLK